MAGLIGRARLGCLRWPSGYSPHSTLLEVRMSRERLSKLQKWVLMQMLNDTDWSFFFDKTKIYKEYFNLRTKKWVAAVVISRSLKRLKEKGLIAGDLSTQRRGLYLTDTGKKVAGSLMLIATARET